MGLPTYRAQPQLIPWDIELDKGGMFVAQHGRRDCPEAVSLRANAAGCLTRIFPRFRKWVVWMVPVYE